LILDSIPIELNTIISDKHYIEENLLCLLSNAIKYSTHGIIRVNVSTTECKSQCKYDKNVRVTVTDNGIGISDESKIKLFKKFSSVQNMATGSTGLGLYSLLKRSEAINGSYGMQDREDGEQGNYLSIYIYIHIHIHMYVYLYLFT
jgi:signal transduction histidine kinase